MEVGMGGRFDATNVIKPEVCFLTAISYDHMEVLGDTLTKIAIEKCGIIKPGCVVISHPQRAEAARVIERDCQEKSVRLIRVGQDVTRRAISHDLEHQEIEVNGRLDHYRISIPLLGDYQLDNVTAAVAGLEVLMENELKVSKDAILQGLAGVKFPGRLQIIQRQPLIVVDGGHNPSAAHNLKKALDHYFKPEKAVLVIGLSNDKDLPGMVRELAHNFDLVIATSANNPRSTPPEVISAELAKYGVPTRISESVPTAIELAKSQTGIHDLICITGSLFVVGEALGYLQNYGKEAV
jgi:dihydrofolate synthase/folylpolyglutamate synthase